MVQNNSYSTEFQRAKSDWLIDYLLRSECSRPGPRFHTQVEMAINEDNEAAIATAFSQLEKAKQLEAAREFVKGQEVFVSIPSGSGKSLASSARA